MTLFDTHINDKKCPNQPELTKDCMLRLNMLYYAPVVALQRPLQVTFPNVDEKSKMVEIKVTKRN